MEGWEAQTVWSQVMPAHNAGVSAVQEKRGKANEKLEVINLNISRHTLNIV